MKKSIYLFIVITLFSGIGMTAKAADRVCPTGAELNKFINSATTAYTYNAVTYNTANGNAVQNGDVVILNGSYNWSALINPITISFSVKADPSLTTRPVITYSNASGASYFIKAKGNSLPIQTITFDGVDIVGTGTLSATGFITVGPTVTGANTKIVINNCVLRRFASTAFICTYTTNTVTPAPFGDFTITNSRLIGFGSLFATTASNANNSPANLELRNNYFSTYHLNTANVVNISGTSLNINHCTFNDAGTGTKLLINSAAGSNAINNSVFANCSSQSSNNSISPAATGSGNINLSSNDFAIYGVPGTIATSPSLANPTLLAVASLSTTDSWYYASSGTAGYNSNTYIPGSVSTSNFGLWTTSDVIVLNGDHLTINSNTTINSLTIERGGKVTLNNGNTLTVTNFNINSDASGTGTFVDANATSGLTVTGSANVQQYLTGKTGTSTRANWYLSSPVSGATAAVFNVAGLVNKMTAYDETTHGYVTQFTSNSTALTPGKGYVTYIGGADATYTFSTSTGSNTAKLNSGGITVTPAPTRTGTSDAKRGFNLVGNPYPSFLDWKDVNNIKTNLRSTIWYRTLLLNSVNGTMTFDTYDGTTGTSNGANGAVTQYIPPMQAFWVKVDADGQTAELTFTNTARSHQNQSLANRLRVPSKNASEPAIVRLRVSNGTNADETILVADANATDALDTYDSEKMSTNNTAIPEIYTMAGSEELVINHLNDFAINKQVALGFRPGTNSTFSIVANELSNVDAQTKVILIDKLQNNAEFDLTNGSAYTFSADATPTTDRFVIAFRAPGVATNLSNTNTVNMFVYKNANNQIAINLNSTEEGIVTICNAIGQKLESTPTTGTTTVIGKSYGKGVYFVTVSVSGSKSTQKVILN